MAKAENETIDVAEITARVKRQLEQDQDDAYHDADQILRDAVADDHLSLENRKRLFRLVGWDDKETDKQLKRMRKVAKLQAVAGTAADRQALAAEAEQSAKIFAENRDRLLEEIRTRQSQLRLLEESAAQAQRRQEEVQAALKALTELVPDDVIANERQAKQVVAKSVRERLSELETELAYRRQLAAGQPQDNNQAGFWWDQLRKINPNMVRPRTLWDGQPGHGYDVDPVLWSAVTREWEAERPALEAELAELRQEYNEAKAAMAEARQLYWR